MRRTRYLGFAVLAAAALTMLLGAGTASATQFRAEEYPTTLNGTQSVTHTFTTVSGTVKCQTANTSGTLSAASSSVSLTPEMKSCIAFGLVATPVLNSCKYVLNSTNEAEPFTGTVDIACSKEGDAMEFKTATCVLKIPAQKGFATGLANSEFAIRSRNRRITETINAGGIKYTQIGACPKGSGNFENGTLTGTSVIRGYNAPAEHAVGVYLANEQVSAPPLFSTEGGPWGITSGATTMQASFGISFNCSFQVDAGEFPVATDKLTLGVSQWKGCYYGHEFSVNPNGCTLGFQATTSENEDAWGVLNIDCPLGAAITFSAFFGQCNVSIPAQANRAKLTFNTVGTGKGRKVATGVSVSGLTYTGSGGLSACKGTHEDGSLSSSFHLSSPNQGFFVAY